MTYNTYGKRPLWQWIVLYLIIGGAAYALIYYFFFAGRNGYFQTAPSTPESEEAQESLTLFEVSLVLAESQAVGQYLTAGNGMTLYVFSGDEIGVSKCTGTCTINWPPYTVIDPEALEAGEGISGAIAVLERADGALQVTYNGLPLYFWVNDREPGDVTGHGIGGFSVAKP